VVADTMTFIDRIAPAGVTSLQRDIADGRASELRYWNGAVVKLGREAGVATPTHAFISAVLQPQERRARGEVEFPA
jgi:2-dehydropantoate 2-reductase